MKFIKKHPILFFEIVGIILIIIGFTQDIGDGIDGLLLLLGLAIVTISPFTILYFKWLFKQINNNKARKKNKLNEIEIKLNNSSLIYAVCKEITKEDKQVLEDFELCFNEPRMYYQMNIEEFIERGIEHYPTDEEIQWLSMVNILIKHNYAVELDWKCDFDEFNDQIQTIKNCPEYELTNTPNQPEDVESWIEELNNQWENSNYCLGIIDINSDSYVLFVTEIDKISLLNALASRVNYKIYTIGFFQKQNPEPIPYEKPEYISQNMQYDETLEKYVIEIRNIVFTSEEEQNEDYINKLETIADNYHNNFEYIVEFMLPALKSFYDDIDEKNIKEKLGKPTIDYDNGIVQYLDQSFDNTHIFTFEFLDLEFKELQYFAIDG